MEYPTDTGLLHYDDTETGKWFEIRQHGKTLFVCVSVGQNLSAYRDGTRTSRAMYAQIESYLKGASMFSSIKDLYDWLKQYEDRAYGRGG